MSEPGFLPPIKLKPHKKVERNEISSVLITMPALGVEGKVFKWFKNVGDSISFGEPLLEVTSEIGDTEISSPVAGTVIAIDVPVNTLAPVGTRLSLIARLGFEETARNEEKERVASLEAKIKLAAGIEAEVERARAEIEHKRFISQIEGISAKLSEVVTNEVLTAALQNSVNKLSRPIESIPLGGIAPLRESKTISSSSLSPVILDSNTQGNTIDPDVSSDADIPVSKCEEMPLTVERISQKKAILTEKHVINGKGCQEDTDTERDTHRKQKMKVDRKMALKRLQDHEQEIKRRKEAEEEVKRQEIAAAKNRRKEKKKQLKQQEERLRKRLDLLAKIKEGKKIRAGECVPTNSIRECCIHFVRMFHFCIN